MKAAQFNAYGGIEVVEINNNAPTPTPAKDQVLVEVYAASLNPIDWKVRAGFLKDMVPLQFPVTLGGDFSGIVKAIGEGVTEFKVGDEVYGQASVLNGGSGSLAEFAATPVMKVAHKPISVDHVQAAALPLAGISALQALEEHIKLKPKKKILIHGGSGGIGSIAIQIAKSKGAYVATTASTENAEFVKGLGADLVIDYKQQKFEEIVKDFDAVLDTVGGDTTDKSFKILKRGGVFVSMLGQPNPDLAKQHGVTAVGQMTDSNTQKLNKLKELVDNGIIQTKVDKVFPLAKTKEAFEYLEKGHPRGKVVVRVKEK